MKVEAAMRAAAVLQPPHCSNMRSIVTVCMGEQHQTAGKPPLCYRAKQMALVAMAGDCGGRALYLPLWRISILPSPRVGRRGDNVGKHLLSPANNKPALQLRETGTTKSTVRGGPRGRRGSQTARRTSRNARTLYRAFTRCLFAHLCVRTRTARLGRRSMVVSACRIMFMGADGVLSRRMNGDGKAQNVENVSNAGGGVAWSANDRLWMA